MKKVFIDGSAGTTGLRIRERLAGRKDLEILTIAEEFRKDLAARRDCFNQADVVFLCLPDDAAREAVPLVENPDTAVIDTSTAHRVVDGWCYGFAELGRGAQRALIQKSNRIANPGCHASGFISLVAPLVEMGILPCEAKLSAFSLTGYTGGGKKMIASYEERPRQDVLLDAPRQYGLSQMHKHLPEMVRYCQLQTAPLFMPIVADFPCGMEVTVPLFAEQLTCNGKSPLAMVKECYQSYYAGSSLVQFVDGADEAGFYSAGLLAGRDSLQVTVAGNEERLILTSRFDNLGKGASGAAIQNMNLRLGCDETLGLSL